MENRRAVGSRYERLAAQFLARNGLEVVEMNYRCRTGEIDIVARDGEYLVFVEVKYRKNRDAGWALEAVGEKKAGQVRRVAAFYLLEHGYSGETPCRFDAIGIDGERITYLKNVF